MGCWITGKMKDQPQRNGNKQDAKDERRDAANKEGEGKKTEREELTEKKKRGVEIILSRGERY